MLTPPREAELLVTGAPYLTEFWMRDRKKRSSIQTVALTSTAIAPQAQGDSISDHRAQRHAPVFWSNSLVSSLAPRGSGPT
jgi:hypothetical protein